MVRDAAQLSATSFSDLNGASDCFVFFVTKPSSVTKYYDNCLQPVCNAAHAMELAWSTSTECPLGLQEDCGSRGGVVVELTTSVPAAAAAGLDLHSYLTEDGSHSWLEGRGAGGSAATAGPHSTKQREERVHRELISDQLECLLALQCGAEQTDMSLISVTGKKNDRERKKRRGMRGFDSGRGWNSVY
ncbi:hypothetical protein EYF80_004098 [Liparis tanakae]|uniref:Uncharacterized protein n=1 Tax=Liparis tanakae TaxID=230148 RepID=A0A4Z2J5K2_9TELE|nr:hypothetical protein EYF80_004098 [Liparis tanakae]